MEGDARRDCDNCSTGSHAFPVACPCALWLVRSSRAPSDRPSDLTCDTCSLYPRVHVHDTRQSKEEGEAARNNVVMSAGKRVAVPTSSVICYLLHCIPHSRRRSGCVNTRSEARTNSLQT